MTDNPTDAQKTTPPKDAKPREPEEKKETLNSQEQAPSPEPSEDDLQSQLEKAQSELENTRKEFLYLRAESENQRKRIQREQEQKIRLANEKFVSQLLPIVDSLERALESGKPLKESEKKSVFNNFFQGVEVTYNEFMQMLKRFDVEFFGKVGEAFDPNRHDAISQVETEEQEPDTIVQVFQRGCLIKDRLISPAKVIVAKEKAQGSQDNQS